MQIAENGDRTQWHLWSFVIVSLVLTVFTLIFAVYRFDRMPEGGPDDSLGGDCDSGGEDSDTWLTKARRVCGGFQLVRIKVEERPLTAPLV
jgi:protein-S-isoprenylcysteine O-methyltransferase Ste14